MTEIKTDEYNDIKLCLNRNCHSKNGSAINYSNRTKYWYLNGKRHRENGPAIEYSNGDKWWFLNGELHRENGPAIEYSNGDKEWFLNGKRHREDGPAIEWYLNRKHHHKNGLTVEFTYKKKEWYLNGERHRENGPAIENNIYGYKGWFLNGKRHREDGPAMEWRDGVKRCYFEDKRVTPEWLEEYKKLKNKHSLLGVPVRDKYRVKQIVMSWYDNPRFKCVQNRLFRDYKSLNEKYKSL